MKIKNLLSGLFLLFFFSNLFAQTQIYGLASGGGLYSGGVLYKMNPDGSSPSIVFEFQSPEGWKPMGEVMKATNGFLYGTCYEGGDFASCTIFEHDNDTCRDVYDFDITNGDFPTSGLVEGPGAKLYGVATWGGSGYAGVIYSYDLASQFYESIYDFDILTGDMPYETPILVAQNFLFGITALGGDHSMGTLYKYDIANDTLMVLHHFDTLTGGLTYGGLTMGTDGMLYGMTGEGGTYGWGTVFSFDTTGNIYTVLHNFNETEGKTPMGTMVLGLDGDLYGTAAYGGSGTGSGADGGGVLFRIHPSGNNFTVLHHFDTATGCNPQNRLTLGPDGKIYGTTLHGGGTLTDGVVYTFDPLNSSYQVMMSFNGVLGYAPMGGIAFIDGPVGNFESLTPNFLTLSPNPANESVEISASIAGEVQVSLHDLMGREMWVSEGNFVQGKFSEIMKVSDLTPGIYIVNVVSASKTFTSRLVIE